MSTTKRVAECIIRVSPETAKILRAYARAKDLSVKGAADALIATAKGRLGALARYAKAQKAKAKIKGRTKRAAR